MTSHGKLFWAKMVTSAAFVLVIHLAGWGWCAPPPVSDATQECLGCHESIHPGIVSDWKTSRHASVCPKEAAAIKGAESRFSAAAGPEPAAAMAVGCAECHTLRSKEHADTFEHNGFQVHLVVSPGDCAVCHPKEEKEYSKNLMSYALTNLSDNPVYKKLEQAITGGAKFAGNRVSQDEADASTKEGSCYYCHGTRLAITGIQSRETAMGQMDFPKISGWPNQGVGRINLDNSKGSCTSCHGRHAFSMAVARKPYTCKECHVGPDVPAYAVYSASKHGNMFASQGGGWDFEHVPWTVGKDFTAPTCAACHISLLQRPDGETVAQRTHQMGDRLAWRLFGLIYAHPHPAGPDTTIIKNSAGLPLATDFDGGYATGYLLNLSQQQKNTASMQAVCLSCHTRSWVDGHWTRLDKSVATTNAQTKTATQIMGEIWKRGYAKGVAQGQNPFDEAVERIWSEVWLFFGNTARFAAAMAGGGDYASFKNGWFQMNKSVAELDDWLRVHEKASQKPTAKIQAKGFRP